MYVILMISGVAVLTASYGLIRIVEEFSTGIWTDARRNIIEQALLTTLIALAITPFFHNILAFPVALLLLNLPLFMVKKRNRAKFLQKLNRELSFVALSLSLLIEAGCSIQSGVATLHRSLPENPSKIFLADILSLFEMGVDVAKVKREISRIYNSEYADLFLEILMTGKTLGSGPGKALKQLSDKMMSDRVIEAEEKALKAPVKLMIPLCLFIFPAIFLLIFSPVILQMESLFR